MRPVASLLIALRVAIMQPAAPSNNMGNRA
jgi:hypothetical protein